MGKCLGSKTPIGKITCAHVLSSEGGKPQGEKPFILYNYIYHRLTCSLVGPLSFFFFSFLSVSERTFSIRVPCFNNPGLFIKLHILKIILKWSSSQKDPLLNKGHCVNWEPSKWISISSFKNWFAPFWRNLGIFLVKGDSPISLNKTIFLDWTWSVSHVVNCNLILPTL